jgi:hypothetical protein
MLKRHFERIHSERGAQRRKHREEALAKYLTSVAFGFDRVNFCGEGSKKFARVDFVIHKHDRYVAVECDEDAHKTYGVLCDVRRMLLDVVMQLTPRSELPLRNPDAYAVDGQAQKPKMGERRRELLLAIETPVTAPLTVTYVCYDTTGGVADVTRCDEFPPDLHASPAGHASHKKAAALGLCAPMAKQPRGRRAPCRPTQSPGCVRPDYLTSLCGMP